jgi:hypothetical protein
MITDALHEFSDGMEAADDRMLPVVNSRTAPHVVHYGTDR